MVTIPESHLVQMYWQDYSQNQEKKGIKAYKGQGEANG